jgi:MFS transporter, OFA family, oxalate/formate antiporter
LITGIAAAGFGLAAVVLSFFAETLLMQGRSVLQIFLKIGIVYGVIILVFAFFMKAPASVVSGHRVDVRYFSKSPEFRKLVAGIFLGTFAGLLVIGSLSPMGAQYGIDNHVLVLGVSAFAVANFCGRLFWGFISDYINSKTAIFIALTLQAFAIFFIGYLSLTEVSFLVLSVLIGFGFGSNFVLFAKETSQKYGIGNMGIVYPYVFMGYAVAGIIGPMTGGLLFDYFQNYQLASYIAAFMSFAGAMVSLVFRNSKV